MPDPLPPALVLTAGLGRRLAPLTDVRAKPAVPVAGRPLVLRILDWLARQGVADVVLNLHHRPETITRAVGYGAAAGVRVRYSWEPALLGSAGGPRQALPLLGPRFFVVNGDTLTDLRLRELLDSHRRTGAAVTLGVTPHPDPARYGGGLVASDGRVRGVAPAGGGAAAHFVGVQVVEASAFASLPAGRPASTVGGLYDRLVGSSGDGPGGIRALGGRARFLDVGTPPDYLAVCAAVAAKERPGSPGPASAPAPGAGSIVHPTAVLTNTVVWDRVVIGPRCRLEDCIVTDDVDLPAGTELRRAICVAHARAPGTTADRTGPPRSQQARVIGNARVFALSPAPGAEP
ncbi:MAG: NDP-sugar synthase [Acidobacteria bacterium]|nr:NDP-sugar synthase [Acidobacteriota bacterium]